MKSDESEVLDPGGENRDGEAVVGIQQVALSEPAAGSGGQAGWLVLTEAVEGFAGRCQGALAHISKVAFGPLDSVGLDGLDIGEGGELPLLVTRRIGNSKAAGATYDRVRSLV